MKLESLFVYFTACFASLHLCSANMDDLKLELVQVVSRHGARTPSKSEAAHVGVSDPTIYGPVGFNQLTNRGKEQTYKLGVLLRRKYDEFLGAYNPEEFEAVTTGYIRTKQSLQLTLAGLFSPSSEEKWNPQLKWRPVPFRQNIPTLDPLLTPHQCPKFVEIYKQTINSSKDYQQMLSNYKEFLVDMENKTGFPYTVDQMYEVGWTYYAVQYHRAYNLPLPSWYTGDSTYKTLEELSVICLNGMSLTTKLKRLNGGTLVRKFIKNINTNRNAVLRKKIYVYCTHDLTLIAFSKAQSFEAFRLPPMGSALIMEKYSDSQKTEYIRILSWDGSSDEFMTVRIADCEEFCPMKDYLKVVENFIPSDEELNYLCDGIPESNSTLHA